MESKPTRRWTVAWFADGWSSRPEAQYPLVCLEWQTRKPDQRLIWVVIVTLATILMSSAWLLAQTPQPMPPGPPPNPARPPLAPVDQVDENFTFLRNPTNRTDMWDPLKY